MITNIHATEYITVEEFAELMRVPQQAVRIWIRQGKMPPGSVLRQANTTRIHRSAYDAPSTLERIQEPETGSRELVLSTSTTASRELEQLHIGSAVETGPDQEKMQMALTAAVFSEQDIARFWGKVELGDGCWHYQGYLKVGTHPYGRFWAQGKKHRAHRVSYVLARGPIPLGLVVCHACDNPQCVRPDHLWLGTLKENMADMVRKGRHASGARFAGADDRERRRSLQRSPGRVAEGRCGPSDSASDKGRVEAGVCRPTPETRTVGRRGRRWLSQPQAPPLLRPPNSWRWA